MKTRVFCLILIGLLAGCSDQDDPKVTDLTNWIGDYEIEIINGEAVDCDIIFLIPEIIRITKDRRFQVISLCDNSVMVEGDYEFSEGLFLLYVDWVVQEPVDEYEFEMQIFQESNSNVRIYRCTALSGSCSVRLGRRV